MPLIELLAPAGHRRLPWKNGRGELVVIDREGSDSWHDMGVAWHFGRTAIVKEGPFSDYSGYERLQVVTKGAGLVLMAPDHAIDLRDPMQPSRYDGGTPIRTRLEKGPVEVVNLIADRARFDIDLRVGNTGEAMVCAPGRHILYAAIGDVRLDVDERAFVIPADHALRVHNDVATRIGIGAGQLLVGSIFDRPRSSPRS